MKKITNLKVVFKIINKRIVVLIILLSLSILSKAQLDSETKPFSLINKSTDKYEITSFICRYIEGRVYSMWTVLEPSNDCIYVFERSGNGQKYDILYSKKGVKSPANFELLNSFIDEYPLKGQSYYRVRRLTKEESMISSSYVVNDVK